VRQHLRLTLQPVDPPADPKAFERVLDQIGSEDMLLFSTDYPHAHFEGTDALPEALAGSVAEKVLAGNALATYPRLRQQQSVREIAP
jgi:predicted TIM-barrel fold metal-dependent hydrolase